MTLAALIVLVGLAATLVILALGGMRPGFTLLLCAVIFMLCGVISPEELLDGFSSKEMITVAMLFLIAEGVRSSGALSHLVRTILPVRGRSIGRHLSRILPPVTLISMVLNNTAVVIIFAPIIKRWAERVGLPPTKFLIPLSYAAILGGVCTLIGTSTNLVVNGLMIENGYEGFTMFEIGKVGFVIAIVGLIYLFIFGNMLLPEKRTVTTELGVEIEEGFEQVEVILNSRFPGMGRSYKEFDFKRHYGAKIIAISQNGDGIEDLDSHIFAQGDMVTLLAEEHFTRTWRETSAFYIISDVEEPEQECSSPKRWIGFGLMIFMMAGATLGESLGGSLVGVKLDMFFFAALVMVIMAAIKLFPPKRYTKFITWDILIAIAAAFAISRAMINSGISDMVAELILGAHGNLGPYGVLALLYIFTMLLTELITNSAAVAICFPLAVALSEQMGIDARPLFIGICIAASASFSSPIGYQTNLIVQGVGGYKFKDYLRIGIWLNLITLLISVFLIPRIWHF